MMMITSRKCMMNISKKDGRPTLTSISEVTGTVEAESS